jgi:hypothetical protein
MTINASDLKLFESQEMDDTPQGGGRQTGSQILDGTINNIFRNTSRLDRTYGRINLLKMFLQVDTLNSDPYGGAHFIVSDAPDDLRVHVTAFSTNDDDDHRADARDYVEAYVVAGPRSEYVLYEDQLAGQRSILVFANMDAPAPSIGEVYLLSTEKTGFAANQQYVRIQDVAITIRTFHSQQCGTFQVQVMTLGIADTLKFRFYGQSPSCEQGEAPTLTRTTLVADLARYYGITRLSDDAAVNDLTIKVDSILTQIVPSTNVETPIADAQAGGLKTQFSKAGPVRNDAYNLSGSQRGLFAAAVPTFIGRAIYPKSISFNSHVAVGGGVITDDGNGNLVDVNGDLHGTVDYATGRILTSDLGYNNGDTVNFSWQPAVVTTGVANTDEVAITLGTRGFNYVRTLAPIPSPRSLVVSFKAQGRWYSLSELGNGELAGADDSFGTGRLDYSTGTVTVTLGALPDVGTSVLFAWGTNVHYEQKIAGVTVPKMSVVGTLANVPLVHGSITATWTAGGVTKNAADNNAAGFVGAFTGDAVGSIDYHTGEFILTPTIYPDAGSGVTLNYTKATQQQEPHSVVPSGGTTGVLSFSTATVPVTAGGFRARFGAHTKTAYYNYSGYSISSMTIEVADKNGDGILYASSPSAVDPTIAIGTIDYATGAVAINADALKFAGIVYAPSWNLLGGLAGGNWIPTVATGVNVANPTVVSALYNFTSASSGAHSDTVATPNPVIDLTPTTLEHVVPTSIDFVWAGHRYIDRIDGKVYRDIDATNNSAIEAGTINYETGRVTLTDYISGANALTLKSLVCKFGDESLVQVMFRAPGAPLRPGSFFIRAVDSRSGTQLTATTDTNGNIISSNAVGSVDQQNGIVRVTFGRLVLDSSLTADEKDEWWYDAANVDGTGHIFRPYEVEPNTILYNTVVLTSVPLNSNILGLDPTRLPLDGKVPFIRDGDVIVIAQTLPTELDNPVPRDTPISLRPALAQVRVTDTTGAVVDPALYTIDLETGDITFPAAADLSAYDQPLTAAHRIEDMAQVADRQIDGTIQITSPLTHDYPADGTSVVSSALLIGDLQSRAYNLFTQQTWTGVWAEAPIGNGTNGQYDIAGNPIHVENRGAVRQRWRVVFTSTTAFNLIGETLGQIATGDTAHDLVPINPATSTPYFLLDKDGWSAGWAAGNVVRFNTDGANAPIWLARTIESGPATETSDSARVEFRGDAN